MGLSEEVTFQLRCRCQEGAAMGRCEGLVVRRSEGSPGCEGCGVWGSTEVRPSGSQRPGGWGWGSRHGWGPGLGFHAAFEERLLASLR